MFTDIFGIIKGIVGSASNISKDIVSNSPNGNAQRRDVSRSIAEMLAGHRLGPNANLAKEAKKNIGQFPIIMSNAIGDEQALKVCEIVERSIADMILLCIQNGNDLIDLRDPEAKRKFIDQYTNAGNTSLDYDTLNLGRKAFASDYKTNCLGIDAMTLKRVANEAMLLEDNPISSSFEMSTLFNPCLSLEEEFDLGAIAPVSAPMGAATSGDDDEYDEYDEDESDIFATEGRHKREQKRAAAAAKANAQKVNLNGASSTTYNWQSTSSGSGSSSSSGGSSSSSSSSSGTSGASSSSSSSSAGTGSSPSSGSTGGSGNSTGAGSAGTGNPNGPSGNGQNGPGGKGHGSPRGPRVPPINVNINNGNSNGNGNNGPKVNAAYPNGAGRGSSGGRLKNRKYLAYLDGTKAAKIEEKVSKLSPTIVNATVLLQTPTDTIERNIAFGVKVNAHEVASNELVKAIKETYSSTSLITRLIRWRSGELSFFKDVLLNLKEIKQTVAARNNRNTKNGLSGVFASMRFMTKNSLAVSTLSSNGALLPTVSIMMDLDEVDQIKNSCGKDLLKNIKDARELCNKLGLFGILIVDVANDSFYSYFNDDASMYKKTSLKDSKNKNSDDVVKAIFGALKR